MKKNRKDRIYALVGKPHGRKPNRYWNAFSFTPNSNQSDVEAFMISIHYSGHNYYLIRESDLEAVPPYKNSPNQRTIYYFRGIFICDTPVSLIFENRIELGENVKNRMFKVR